MTIIPRRYDGCLTSPDSDKGSFGVSNHRYRYSIGVNDDWTVKVPGEWSGTGKTGKNWFAGIPEGTEYQIRNWRNGGPYEYGCGIAHYPVPAKEHDRS